MKFWQSVAWVEPEQLVAVARFAEELGFEGIINADHAVYPETVRARYPYAADGRPPMCAGDPYPDCWVSIAFMAAATTRLRFTTGVYVLPLRNPFEVAKACASLSIFSAGRFALGLGAGWMADEFEIYGVPFSGRGRRMDEMIEVMQRLWAGGMVSYRGEFHDFPPLCIEPAPTHPVPIYVGGDNPAALRRAAARGDGWIGAGNLPEEVPGILRQLRALRASAGRDWQGFETLIGLKAEVTTDMLQALGEQGMSAAVAPPFAFSLGKRSSLADKQRQMEQYTRTVMRHFT
jgi:probable F420-dependent oxidoreductase